MTYTDEDFERWRISAEQGELHIDAYELLDLLLAERADRNRCVARLDAAEKVCEAYRSGASTSEVDAALAEWEATR